MIRAVLAVVFATALLGVAMAPLDDARRQRASATVTDQIETIEQAAKTLVQTDDPTDGDGARRIVTVRLPARHWSSASVERLSIGPGNDQHPSSITWRVRGGTANTRSLPGITIATADSDPVVLREAGTHRLVLELDGETGEPVVTVRRFK